MKFFTNKKGIQFRKKAAFALAVIMLVEAVNPAAIFALTSGPGAPEFSSFEPVATTNMVDEFTGDFTYNIPVLNIPGANGGGYAMSLAYHSGENVEAESSWVGYGWTLNPGAINRGKRGFADDTRNTTTYYNDVPKNWTVSTGVSVGNIELFSFGIPLSVNGSLRYNNYRGYGYTAGAGLSFQKGLVSLGYSVSDGSGSFSAQVNPAALLSKNKEATEEEIKTDSDYKAADKAGKKQMRKEAKAATKKERAGMTGKEVKSAVKSNVKGGAIKGLIGLANACGVHALGEMAMPTTVTPYEGMAFNTNFNLQTNPSPLEVGPQFGFYGSYNYQKNKPEIDRTGYGYLYSSSAYTDNSGVMDYYTEKESGYNKRDRYMGIPFSNADMFSVSGEGLGGAFRLYNSELGYFRPNEAKSQMPITSVSGDINLGLEYGGGFNLGLGLQTLTVDGTSWGNSSLAQNATDFNFNGTSSGTGNNDANFMRFNNDLGGSVDFGDPLAPNRVDRADILVNSPVPGAKTCHPEIDATVSKQMLSTIKLSSGTPVARSGRGQYIAYHTNLEMATVAAGTTKQVYSYDRRNYSSLIDRAAYPEQIGEIATVNEEGNTYVYGLPVMVKNETNLQYDLKGVSASAVQSNFRVEKDISSYEMKIGEVDHGAYASSYLLTQITSSDYVDRTLDGPSLDDFGGYTKFNYVKTHNVDDVVGLGYHYRMPYSGLNYSRAEMTDPSDDMGSYSSGDKDIAYLDRIETKTHIAVFVRSNRQDGFSAASDASAASNFNATGGDALQQLDEIQLYTNNNGALGKLIKKVIFKYDYTLCQGTLNSSSTLALHGGVKGKLTLKQLWFEYEGIVTAKISPYKFKYTYPKNINAAAATETALVYPPKYTSFQNEYGDRATMLAENPSYSSFAIDAWGNYQDGAQGATRFAAMRPWVNQKMTGADAVPATFDPAAWQLKAITLPSGGEIHVQYEQDDYLYVQDRRAEALVSINESDMSPHNTGGVYTLNCDEIGVTSAPDKAALVKLINDRYSGDKIYFKFLYALLGGGPQIGECNTDYITGYVNFNGASINAISGDVEIDVGNSASGYDLPRDVCLDLVKKQKGGKLNTTGECNAAESGVTDGLSVKDMVMQLVGKIGTSFFAGTSACLEVNPDYSYFKIPVLNAKKGGGLRVKRILMFDKNGIDTGMSALYGSEYFYQQEDGTSSGVTTNEPSPLRDENALVTFLPKRNEQSFASKVVSGVDRDQFEGPIGESLIPSGSVGYSRVVTKNIHSGKTNTGFIVNEFYTTRDYPFDMHYGTGLNANAVDNTSVDKEKDWMNLPAIVFNYSVTNIWASQGYRFILNSMHGQPKTVATYSGDFTPGGSGTLTTYAKSSSTEYQYFQPGETIEVLNPDGTTTSQNPGKDMDISFEMRSMEDVTVDASIEIDFGVGIAGVIPLPQASLSPLVSYSESKMRTHVTSKVIKYPVIQKAVITSQDGIVHKTENLVFSAYTGKPVVTRTTDGYEGLPLQQPSPGTPHNGSFTSYNTPAYSQYKEMGQKAINERLNITPGVPGIWSAISIKSSIVSGQYYLNFAATPPATVCDAMGSLTRGDLIKIIAAGTTSYFHVDEIYGSSMKILPAYFYNAVPTLTAGLTVDNIEIIRSGRTNQLGVMAGSYVTYGGPQSIVSHPAVHTAQQVSFINALNSTLVGGGTVALSGYPLNFLNSNDGSCTPISQSSNVVVSAVSGGTFSINVATSANYVLNGNFSSVNATCATNYPSTEFINGCVDHWVPAYGSPDYQSGGYPLLQCYDYVANGIMQNGIILDPLKSYQLSITQLSSIGGATGNIKAYLLNPSSSGLPIGSVTGPITTLAGSPILSVPIANAGTPPFISTATFSPTAGNTQLVIYGEDFQFGGQGLLLDDISIKQVDNCTTNVVTTATLGAPGYFDIDEGGNVVYYSPDNNCYPQTIGCFKFCGITPSYNTLAKVVASEAKTFTCDWPYESNLYFPTPPSSNLYENGSKGKWRVTESYVFKSAITGGSAAATTERNYNDAGVYTLNMFNWKNPTYNDPSKWVKTSTVTKYSPNGDAIEEVDPLGIYSAAKFGYSHTVPYIVAQNSNYGHVQFISFEKNYAASFIALLEDALIVPLSAYFNPTTGNIAHSGKGSYKMTSSAVSLTMKPILSNTHLQNAGLSCKVWVKDATWSPVPIKGTLLAALPADNISMTFTRVAQSGEWTLYEAKVTTMMNGLTYTPFIQNNLGTVIYMDDVRVQPLDAQANMYVYDPTTLRLVTSFDDQHFGLYYQYNQEGKLVRKMIETEKGMKTITETQYHTPALDSRP